MKSLHDYTTAYSNTGAVNDKFHQEFTANTDTVPLLKEHRDYVEKNKLGFGDRAFHYMWYILLDDLRKRFERVKMLEIGVYKGQVISLWSLLSKEMKMSSQITAVTPLEGNIPKNKLMSNRYIIKIRSLFSPAFRKCIADGNHYLIEDYEAIVSSLFERFGLTFSDVKLYRGYSNNPEVLSSVTKEHFHLIYIDGDHSYEGALRDIQNYTPLIEKGGYLVMDDASWFLEGSVFWKGHKEVSRASEGIEQLGFRNVLNIGHNRVYEKL
jgi:hypothetical protein